MTWRSFIALSQNLVVSSELVEPPATQPEPFDKLRANGDFFTCIMDVADTRFIVVKGDEVESRRNVNQLRRDRIC